MDGHINLLQPDLLEVKVRGRVSAKKGLLFIFILVMVVVLVGFYFQDQKRAAVLLAEVETIRQQRDQLRRQIEAVSAVSQSTVRASSPRSDSVGTDLILKERISWSHILREVSLIIPKGVWVTELENAAGEGVRIAGFAQSHKKVTEMMSSMETSRYFQDVLLEFSRRNPGQGRFDFSIHSGVRREPFQGVEDG